LLIVLLESILLSVLGGVGGWLLGHALIAAFSGTIYETTGVALGFFRFVPWESVIIPSLVVLAAVVGFFPALVAYRTDVAKALQATP
jgi:putative ABC transport system permease protein